ncbi:MAG: hypothetical protein WBZ48_04720 [Bacteroidota bacterium]
MRNAISLLMLLIVVLTLLGPVSVQPNTSVQMSVDEMNQLTAGKTSCGFYYGYACCCLDLWIAQVCFCIG